MSNLHAQYEDRKRVATVVQQRRIELGFTQEQLASTAGLSLRTVQNAETAENVLSSLSRSKLEKALDLPSGYLSKVYSSEYVSSNHHQEEVAPLLSPEIMGVLDHPDLTPEMRRAIIGQLNREHERFARRAVEFFGLNHTKSKEE